MPKRTAHIFEEKWRSDDVKLQEATDFAALLISERVLLGLKKAGFKNPSPIQVEAVPVGRFGNDLVVQAKSGTGKTLVFTIVALDILNIELKVPQVLILAPTREIAFQICDVVKAVGVTTDGLKCGTFIGGLPIETDYITMQGCQIVVGTPGRITQLFELKILKGHSIRLLVLDEADQLLDPSFKSAMDAIFESLPIHKQIIAASATYPKSLANLVDIYFRTNPTLARLNESDLALLGIAHFTCLVENTQMPVLAYRRKLKALENILTRVKFSQCLVFCNQVSRVETLCSDIKKFGFSATYISSAKDQAARLKAIDSLKRFKCKILVSSDVTSRGIDAENVDLIINVDLPYTTEVYLHRVGRAGRYGSKGVAITLVTGTEKCSFSKIQKEGNFSCRYLPEPVPEQLINWRPKKEKSNDKKSSLLGILNDSAFVQKNKTVSNGIEDYTSSKSNSEDSDDNQHTSSEDSIVDHNINSSDSALNKNAGSEDSAVNLNTSSKDSAVSTSSEDTSVNQSTNSENTSANQSSRSEGTSVNQSTSSEGTSVNLSTSSEDASVNLKTSSEDASVNQNTSSEDTSLNQSVMSKDTSANQNICSDTSVNQILSFEEISLNQNICSDTSVNQILSFEEISLNQNTDSEKASSTNTVLTALGVVGQSSVDEDSDKVIVGNFPALNSEDSASVGKKRVANKSEDKKSNNGIKASKQKKSSSTAVLNSKQSFLNSVEKGLENSLSGNEIKNEKCGDEIIAFVVNFIDDYEKKNTADLPYPLVGNEDVLLYSSSEKTDHPKSIPLMRRNLMDYYYKVFQSFKGDFIADNGVEQLELIMAGNEESAVEKKDGKYAAVHIERDEIPIADQINPSLWANKLGYSTYSETNCTEVEASAENILVSTPNAKASKADNLLVVSSDTPPFPSSFDYQDTGDSSCSKYSSKCLQLENAHKSKIGTVNKMQVSKVSKRKVQKIISSDDESSSESETTSSSDTDAENALNGKREAVHKKQVSKHFENLESEAQNIESSESETTSSSDTDSSSNSEESKELTLLERGFREMMRSNDKPQTIAKQADQLKQILNKIQIKEAKSGKGADNDSLSGIQITTAGAHSSRKSHCSDNKSSMKSESCRISRNTGRSSGSGKNLKGQQSKYQSDDQDESVSYANKSSCSEKRKVSKLFKDKTRQRAKGLPTQLNRNEGFGVAEPNNFYFNHPHASRHGGSHFNHQDHFQNAVYPNTTHNIGAWPYHHYSHYHHGNCAHAAFAEQNSSSQPSHCRHSHFNHQGYCQNAAYPNQGHSRSTQHCCGVNGSSVNPLSSSSLNDMYYRQWYWMQQGYFFQ